MQEHVLGTALVLAAMAAAGAAHADTMKIPRQSPAATVVQTIGVTDVTVKYGRPAVKGRTVFGELVPYDKVWRTGANEATTVEFSTDVKVADQALPAGRYSLHTIPGKTEWTFIFNRQADQWGSYTYDEKQDALRVKAPAAEGPATELLTFHFPQVDASSGRLELAWDKVRVGLTITADVQALALKNIADGLARYEDWRTPWRAADWALNNNVSHPDVIKWIDKSIMVQENFVNLSMKARLLARDGKTKDALAVADKAVKLAKANKVDPAEIAAFEKVAAGWKPGKK